MNPKQRAAEAALEYVRSDSVIGLGTGSTADYFLMALGEALKSGRLSNVRGVPTSDQTQRRAAHLGVPLISLAQAGVLDVTIDGTDEIDPGLDLIKGLGGALLREKVVAQNSRSLVIIADASKRVQKLGEKAPVPVEVTTFGHEAQAVFLASLGGEPKLRKKPDGSTFITDNGNLIYDCRFAGGIPDPRELNAALERRAGVVESGLFLGMASIAIVADDGGIQTLRR
ncbi:MAG: ribose-5-phosphate isomerase RpiA [Tepidisphaeraceae bacterium]